jgi:hypothetical protein
LDRVRMGTGYRGSRDIGVRVERDGGDGEVVEGVDGAEEETVLWAAYDKEKEGKLSNVDVGEIASAGLRCLEGDLLEGERRGGGVGGRVSLDRRKRRHEQLNFAVAQRDAAASRHHGQWSEGSAHDRERDGSCEVARLRSGTAAAGDKNPR